MGFDNAKQHLLLGGDSGEIGRLFRLKTATCSD
jgi:hypothetical protein